MNHKLGLSLGLATALLVLVLAGIFAPSFFRTTTIVQILRQAAIPGLIAIGGTFVVLCGRLDLSVGSILSLSSVCAVVVANQTGSPANAVIAAVLVGLAVGIANGWLVAYLRLNSLITTLAMLSIVQGIALVSTGGADMVLNDPGRTTGFGALGRGTIAGLPIPVMLAALIAVICGMLVRQTAFGRAVLAIGGNQTASLYSALKVRRTIFATYLLSGALTGLAGAVYASRVSTARHDSGQGLELIVLAMIILGGTNLFGGAGSILRTVVGVVIIVALQNVLLIAGLPFYTQWIGVAVILLAVAWVDLNVQRRSAS